MNLTKSHFVGKKGSQVVNWHLKVNISHVKANYYFCDLFHAVFLDRRWYFWENKTSHFKNNKHIIFFRQNITSSGLWFVVGGLLYIHASRKGGGGGGGGRLWPRFIVSNFFLHYLVVKSLNFTSNLSFFQSHSKKVILSLTPINSLRSPLGHFQEFNSLTEHRSRFRSTS